MTVEAQILILLADLMQQISMLRTENMKLRDHLKAAQPEGADKEQG